MTDSELPKSVVDFLKRVSDYRVLGQRPDISIVAQRLLVEFEGTPEWMQNLTGEDLRDIRRNGSDKHKRMAHQLLEETERSQP